MLPLFLLKHYKLFAHNKFLAKLLWQRSRVRVRISHNDPDALQDHCVMLKISGQRRKPTPEAKKFL